MAYLKAFMAGFVATLVFHQGMLFLLHLAGPAPAPFNLTPVPPFGLPSVLSLAFWGGVWGLPVWFLIRSSARKSYWIKAVVIGALGPSLLALFVVFPIKGLPLAGGWDPAIMIGALLLNGAWGLGVAIIMRLVHRDAEVSST